MGSGFVSYEVTGANKIRNVDIESKTPCSKEYSEIISRQLTVPSIKETKGP